MGCDIGEFDDRINDMLDFTKMDSKEDYIREISSFKREQRPRKIFDCFFFKVYVARVKDELKIEVK